MTTMTKRCTLVLLLGLLLSWTACKEAAPAQPGAEHAAATTTPPSDKGAPAAPQAPPAATEEAPAATTTTDAPPPSAYAAATPTPAPGKVVSVGDGVYLVPDDRPEGTVKVPVPHADPEEPEPLVLPTTPDVPLELDTPPVFGLLEDGRQTVSLEFSEDATKALATLTGTYKDAGRHIAVVIGGEVISEHKLKALIPDGKVQISCCNPDACARLKAALPTVE